MSDTSQIALIRKLYDARGNVNIFKSLLADDLEYDIAEGFPNGGVLFMNLLEVPRYGTSITV
jgi:uncharacterized protein